MAVNKFFLLSLNIIILFLLGVYLLDLFKLSAYNPVTFVYLFMAAMVMVLIANEFVEKYNISNPTYFIIPGVLAIVAPIISGKPATVALVLGWLLLAPGIVLLVRSIISKKKE